MRVKTEHQTTIFSLRHVVVTLPRNVFHYFSNLLREILGRGKIDALSLSEMNVMIIALLKFKDHLFFYARNEGMWVEEDDQIAAKHLQRGSS